MRNTHYSDAVRRCWPESASTPWANASIAGQHCDDASGSPARPSRKRVPHTWCFWILLKTVTAPQWQITHLLIVPHCLMQMNKVCFHNDAYCVRLLLRGDSGEWTTYGWMGRKWAVFSRGNLRAALSLITCGAFLYWQFAGFSLLELAAVWIFFRRYMSNYITIQRGALAVGSIQTA